MNTYKLLRPLLFTIPPEIAHAATLKSLNLANNFGLLNFIKQYEDDPVTVMGIRFKNRLGLAAGFDKNGDAINPLCKLGFGHIEIGTVTELEHVGNPKPRVKRVVRDQALYNNIGLSNKGVRYTSRKLGSSERGDTLVGISIGSIENNATDVINSLIISYFNANHADYVAVNLSCPNIRHCDVDLFTILNKLKYEQESIMMRTGQYVPIVLKLASDMRQVDINYVMSVVNNSGIDGVIATNSSRYIASEYGYLSGAISGRPLSYRNTKVTERLREGLDSQVAIIASGGVMTAQDAKDRLNAGADLVQIYTGLVYNGIGLIGDILKISKGKNLKW